MYKGKNVWTRGRSCELVWTRQVIDKLEKALVPLLSLEELDKMGILTSHAEIASLGYPSVKIHRWIDSRVA